MVQDQLWAALEGVTCILEDLLQKLSDFDARVMKAFTEAQNHRVQLHRKLEKQLEAGNKETKDKLDKLVELDAFMRDYIESQVQSQKQHVAKYCEAMHTVHARAPACLKTTCTCTPSDCCAEYTLQPL
jgi:exonuclease VII large subunit